MPGKSHCPRCERIVPCKCKVVKGHDGASMDQYMSKKGK